MFGVATVKINGAMHPYLPYHVVLAGKHRIIYFTPIDNLNYEYFDWFTGQSYGVGNLARGLPHER